ncbi:CdaR family transcriptional regulator [Alteribacillus sp. YIM 98480]|uniref:PucR family transcriptional regulator n=1 Tax=Alteribacillus sp. YIM 98480 TaxID=2606599 RepID=UPI00131A6BE5|nr:helix-turn-helix domain-containing protein [Alteribacillus sp. YIM 98480]
MVEQFLRKFQRRFYSLEEFADYISELLDGPVTIEDSNHRLLAYSTHKEHTDSARVSTIIGRRVPEKVINTLWKERIIPALHHQNEAMYIREIKEIGLGNRMAVSIKKSNEILGYIWVLEVNRSFGEREASLLQAAAAKAVTQLQQVHYLKKEQEKNSQELFWRLLTGEVMEEEGIQNDLQNWFSKMPQHFSVVVFETNEEMVEHVHKNIVYITNTSQKIKKLFYTTDRNMLIMLVEPVHNREEKSLRLFIKQCIQLLKERIGVNQVLAGSGELCSHFSEVKDSYEKALDVITINKQLLPDKEKFVFYHELGFYRYAKVLLEQKKRESYTEPVLELLKEYDHKNNTDLCKSLAVYLQHDANMKEASKKLHIHVNTLAYRMKRVEELTNIDIGNAHQKSSLLLEISLTELSD